MGQVEKQINNSINIRSIKGRVLQGSFTVEAALIMPMLFYLMFSLFYLSFYLHDINRIQGYLDKMLNRTSILIKHEADIKSGEIIYSKINQRGILYNIVGKSEVLEDDIRSYITEELSDGLFMMQITDIQVKIEKYRIEAKVKIRTRMPIKGVLSFFKPRQQKVIEEQVTIHDPADTIRMSEVILDTGSKVKGLEELSNIVETVFKHIK